MELLLLDHFSWNVDLPTSASFVDVFLVHAVLSDDNHSGRPLNNCAKARVYVKKYVHYFLEISLQGTYLGFPLRISALNLQSQPTLEYPGVQKY